MGEELRTISTERTKIMSNIPKLPTVFDNVKKPVRLRKMNRLGSGTYGRVYQAIADNAKMHNLVFVTDTLTGKINARTESASDEFVAVKRNFVSPSFDKTIGCLRELHFLHMFKDHPYCVHLKDVSYEPPFTDGVLSPPGEREWITDKVFFVLEKCDIDGDKYIRGSVAPLVNERKLFAVQVLLGIEFMHSRGVYHRDLKPQNILCFIRPNGELNCAKLTDFGLAQYHSTQSMSMPGFVTLWYRAPEIALNKEFDYKVDTWSMGCILFELFSSGNRKFMQPATDDALINSVIERLPFPRDYYILAQQLYPGKIHRSYDIVQQTRRTLEQQLAYTGSQIAQFNSDRLGGKPNSGTFAQLVDLLEHCLSVEPENRLTISQCLNHPFFQGYRELINQNRTLYGINSDGEWILRPEPVFNYNDCPVRTRGMQWFITIYTNRLNTPISIWYSHRIFFHALEMFDRYIMLTNPSSNTPESDLVVWINTFMFMSAKYFRIMVTDLGLSYFATGIYPEEFYIFRNRAQKFEEHVVRDVFKCNIYEPTIYETAGDFLTETSIAYLIKILTKNQIPSNISLKTIWSMYTDTLNQVNRIVSPISSPTTHSVSLLSN